MKPDFLTLAALMFIVGLLASSLALTDTFKFEKSSPPTELQRGFPITS